MATLPPGSQSLGSPCVSLLTLTLASTMSGYHAISKAAFSGTRIYNSSPGSEVTIVNTGQDEESMIKAQVQTAQISNIPFIYLQIRDDAKSASLISWSPCDV